MIKTHGDWVFRLVQGVNGWFFLLSQGNTGMPGAQNLFYSWEYVEGWVVPTFAGSSGGVYYRTVRRDYADGGYTLESYPNDYYASLGPDMVQESELEEESVPPLTGAVTITYSNPVDLEDARAAGLAASTVYAEMSFDWDTWGTATNDNYAGTFRYGNTLKTRYSRVKFKVPDFHTGSYCKITYDIADEIITPTSYTFVSQDNVEEWSGPGSGAQSDPSWLFANWIFLAAPPLDDNARWLCNIRVEIYHGTIYGVKPIVLGLVVEIP